jgi:hypothetical protein
LKTLLKQSDVLYLTGSDPDVMMECIEDHEIEKDLLQYEGIFMGDAAGSKIMMDEYLFRS